MARTLAITVALVSSLLSPAFGQQPDPNSPRWKGVVALRELIEGTDEAGVRAFIDEKISPAPAAGWSCACTTFR